MNILIPLIPHSSRHEKGMSQAFTNINFPTGVAYVVAAIENKFPEANIKVLPFDINLVDTGPEMRQALEDISKEFLPDFIMYGGMITRYNYLIELSKTAQSIFSNAVQILGGSAATWGHGLFENEAPIDFLTVGEAEETIISILSGNTGGVPGIVNQTSTGFQGFLLNK